MCVSFAPAGQEWYGELLNGIFVDETAHVADDINVGDKAMCARYRDYRFHANICFGEDALVSTSGSGVSTDAHGI